MKGCETGQKNEIVLEVSNLNRELISTAFRGYKGFSGGISGNTVLYTTGELGIHDMYAYPDEELKRLHLSAELTGETLSEAILTWQIRDESGKTRKEGSLPVKTGDNYFFCSTEGLKFGKNIRRMNNRQKQKRLGTSGPFYAIIGRKAAGGRFSVP